MLLSSKLNYESIRKETLDKFYRNEDRFLSFNLIIIIDKLLSVKYSRIPNETKTYCA